MVCINELMEKDKHEKVFFQSRSLSSVHWVRLILMNKLAIKMIDAKHTKKGKRILSINEFHTKYPHTFQLNKLVDGFDFSLSLSALLHR